MTVCIFSKISFLVLSLCRNLFMSQACGRHFADKAPHQLLLPFCAVVVIDFISTYVVVPRGYCDDSYFKHPAAFYKYQKRKEQ